MGAGQDCLEAAAHLEQIVRVLDRQLRGLMRLRPTRHLLLFTRRPVFYADFLRNDLQTIAGFYRTHGYLDVRVSSTQTQDNTVDPPLVNIHSQVEEGPLTKVAAVVFTGVTATTPDRLRASLDRLAALALLIRSRHSRGGRCGHPPSS